MGGLGKKVVAPLVGAWIEILWICPQPSMSVVAPLVGAWIEIMEFGVIKAGDIGRSPCGSVD